MSVDVVHYTMKKCSREESSNKETICISDLLDTVLVVQLANGRGDSSGFYYPKMVCLV